jgi:spore coat protein A, manganese oxidase
VPAHWRNGVPAAPAEQGLKDTVPIPASDGFVRVQATFADYLGRFPFHCHILEHASLTGMTAVMEITA